MAAKTTDLIANLPEADRLLLKKFDFDVAAFQHLQQELKAGRFSADRNIVQDPIFAPNPQDILPWPTANSLTAQTYQASGLAALKAGQVAVVVLNGGMATRFGGKVKGVVEVVDGYSFLGLKLRHIAQQGSSIPIFLMNSFATAELTQAHLQKQQFFGLPATQIHAVNQSISLRLTPEGQLFTPVKANLAHQASFYAPGHGDLLAALAHSADFAKFVQQGGQWLMVSNVDNLGATVDPLVIGAHIAAGKAVTVEVAERLAHDTGGAPVRRGNKIEILEGFRLPKSFNMQTLSVFNTNSFVFNTNVIHDHYDLTWFRVDKQVEERPVVQFERLLGEITAFVPSAYLQVPRVGLQNRFMPVKIPQDIESIRQDVQKRFLA